LVTSDGEQQSVPALVAELRTGANDATADPSKLRTLLGVVPQLAIGAATAPLGQGLEALVHQALHALGWQPSQRLERPSPTGYIESVSVEWSAAVVSRARVHGVMSGVQTADHHDRHDGTHELSRDVELHRCRRGCC
jgi:hypothetical protein